MVNGIPAQQEANQNARFSNASRYCISFLKVLSSNNSRFTYSVANNLKSKICSILLRDGMGEDTRGVDKDTRGSGEDARVSDEHN